MDIGVVNMFSAPKKNFREQRRNSSLVCCSSEQHLMMRGEEWIDSCLSQWHECEANVSALIQTMHDYSGAINCQSTCNSGSMQVK